MVTEMDFKARCMRRPITKLDLQRLFNRDRFFRRPSTPTPCTLSTATSMNAQLVSCYWRLAGHRRFVSILDSSPVRPSIAGNRILSSHLPQRTSDIQRAQNFQTNPVEMRPNSIGQAGIIGRRSL
jgi:hypothetical protein